MEQYLFNSKTQRGILAYFWFVEHRNKVYSNYGDLKYN